jgi:hypothetical protein
MKLARFCSAPTMETARQPVEALQPLRYGHMKELLLHALRPNSLRVVRRLRATVPLPSDMKSCASSDCSSSFTCPSHDMIVLNNPAMRLNHVL